ncbi:Hint domain-containing protein [Marivita hallyeonensis]|uniref:Hint domain-containing protein n=1 Tax=Marivita hallyeonensis TaxID=996342 RepID=A0A1M5M4D1_9RHOB|nr:Hint domain-containing protein [Marivita hallyeonensis]SHG72086.1 Hint domain-containing protein [Marivita hallyeonensis]
MPTFNIQVLTETDLLASGGTVGSNGTFATAGSTFTYDAATMPWFTMQIVDNGADTTTLSGDTDGVNTDGSPNNDNEGADGETGALYDPDGNQVGTFGAVASDRWGVLEGSDGSTIFIYEIENFDDIDVYAFSEPLVDGVTYTNTAQNSRDADIPYAQMICLARGTQILTPGGYTPIERLKVGGIVETVDHGPQPIRWIAKSQATFNSDIGAPQKRPVKIRAGTAGNSRDLLLSAQHRVVVRISTPSGPSDVFAVSRHLAEEFDGRIRPAAGIRYITFYNLLFDKHEVIFADGVQVESLYPGPQTRNFPDLGWSAVLQHKWPSVLAADSIEDVTHAYGPLARQVLSRKTLRAALLAGNLSFPATYGLSQARAHVQVG